MTAKHKTHEGIGKCNIVPRELTSSTQRKLQCCIEESEFLKERLTLTLIS